MRKIHVITQKEAVKEKKLRGCTVAVIDVFLATSTIAFLLKNNYEPVYALKDSASALELSELFHTQHILLGESKGESIKGFHYPDPCGIRRTEDRQPAIICSTNGTIAIEKAKEAKKLFISSLVNGHLIAKHINMESDDSSVVLICSGNDDRFSMEDFIGAGQLVEHLVSQGDYFPSDAAKVSRQAYINSRDNDFHELLESETANLLRKFKFPEAMDFVIDNYEKVDVVPVYREGKITNDHHEVKTPIE